MSLNCYKNALKNEHNYIADDGSSKTVAVEQTAAQKIAEAKIYLSSTDWYVIREADSGKVMPSDIKTKRAKARQDIEDNE